MKALAANSRTISAIRKADALPTVIPGGKSKKGTAQGSNPYFYEYPFTVEQASDTSVKVVGATTNTYKNYLQLGNSFVELTEQTVSSITSTGWLYIEITYSSSYTLTAKFSAGETPPTIDNTHGIILVRRIVCADSKISSIELPIQIVDKGGKIY